MDIILHLGAHRTGTLALHHYLRSHRAALEELRMAMWEPDLLRSGLGAGLSASVTPLAPMVKARVQRTLGRLRLRLEQLERGGFDRLIYSDPGLIGNSRENLAERQLYVHLPARLSRLSASLASRCSRVVLVIRSYDDYWASALAQAVVGGMELPQASLMADLAAQPRRWRHLIVEIAATFPRAECLVLPYEMLAGQLDLQLATMLAEPIPAYAGAQQRLHLRPTRSMLRKALKDRRETCDQISAGDDRWQMFDPGQVAAMQGHYAADMQWLAQGADGLARVMGQESGDEGQDGSGQQGDRRGRTAAGLD